MNSGFPVVESNMGNSPSVQRMMSAWLGRMTLVNAQKVYQQLVAVFKKWLIER